MACVENTPGTGGLRRRDGIAMLFDGISAGTLRVGRNDKNLGRTLEGVEKTRGIGEITVTHAYGQSHKINRFDRVTNARSNLLGIDSVQ